MRRVGVEWLGGLLIVAGLAWWLPAGGEWLAQFPVAPAGLAMIFLLTGWRMPTESLAKGATFWRFHLITLALSYLLMPLLCWLLSWPVRDTDLGNGLLFLGCLPTTVASAVVLTGVYGEDEARALFATLLVNVLALFFTPFWLEFFFETGVGFLLDPMSVATKLFVLIVLPLCIGHQLQRFTPAPKGTQRICAWIVFSFVYIALCRVPELEWWAVAYSTGCCAVLYIGGAWLLPSRGLLFSGTQKSIVVGLPLLYLLNGDAAALLLTPLVTYHFMQLLLPSVESIWLGCRAEEG